MPPPIGLVSVDSATGMGSVNGASYGPIFGPPVSFSRDGRFAVFVSEAGLVPEDTNNYPDVYVRDRWLGVTSLVSANYAGKGCTSGITDNPLITPDGRYVAFESSCFDLVAGYPKPFTHGNIYVRDLKEGKTKLVSVNRNGDGEGSGESGWRQIRMSADGRYIAFASTARDLANEIPDTGIITTANIFVRDMMENTTTLVSVNATNDGGGAGESALAAMTPDGRYVVFISDAQNILPGGNYVSNLFIRDLREKTTKLVSVSSRTDRAGGARDYPEADYAVSDDGRYVAFTSDSKDLVENDNNGFPAHTGIDIFVRDMIENKTILVSANAAGTSTANNDSGAITMSPDGRFVAFLSNADDLTANDMNDQQDVYLRDIQAGATTLISVGQDGKAAGIGVPTKFSIIDRGLRPSITSDGRYVSFSSPADNIVPLVRNVNPAYGPPSNAFLRDRLNSTTKLISASYTGPSGGRYSSGVATLDPQGRFLFFFSSADNLTANDPSPFADLFVYQNFSEAGQVQFDSVLKTVSESAGEVSVTVTHVAADFPVSVKYEIAGGSAINGRDYIFAPGTLNFAPGETSKSITITVTDDHLSELDETILIRLIPPASASPPTSAATGSFGEPSVAAIVIKDNDTPVLMNLANSSGAVALDSVTLMPEPFTLVDRNNLSIDGLTRISFFTNVEVPVGRTDAVIVEAKDTTGTIHIMPTEFAGLISSSPEICQLTVRVPYDMYATNGEVQINIKVNGVSSNAATILFKSY